MVLLIISILTYRQNDSLQKYYYISDDLGLSKPNGLYDDMLLKMINSKITSDLTFSANDMMQVKMLSNTIGEARSVRYISIALIYKKFNYNSLYYCIVHVVNFFAYLFS